MRQRLLYLLMPDYDKSDPSRVVLIVSGRVIDVQYSQLLMDRADINLTTAVLLDAVQKKKTLFDQAIALLRKQKLVEGRKPNIHISQQVAKATHHEVEYTDMRGFDDKYYQDLILEALAQHGKLNRGDINRLLLNKLPSILNEKQKTNKIDYLLKKLRLGNKIYVDKQKYWNLV